MAYTTINKSSDYFETTTYTGGATDVSSLSFQPDFVWVKKRSGAEGHALFDAVRGVLKALKSDSANSEDTRSGSLTSFDNDGWSMGGTDGIISAPGSTYVGWSWKANGTGSSNTAGSITSTVSANTTSGFSIVQYTGTGSGATVGHGLGVKPKIIFFKNLDSGTNWVVQSTLLANRTQLVLNGTDAQNTDSRLGNLDSWSNSVFSIGTYGDMNGSGNSHIAYCFEDVKGFSKIGSYVGNGSSDGTFVYTGFKPAFVLIKNSSTTGNWQMLDSKRPGINSTTAQNILQANDSYQEQVNAAYNTDFLSNGFKLRNGNGNMNVNGATAIYMAFAEAPLVGSNGVTAKAR